MCVCVCVEGGGEDPSDMRADLFDHAVILSMPEYHPWRGKGSFWGGEVLMMSFSPS